MIHIFYSLFFFFNDTATTEIYTLSLHDALPIWHRDHIDHVQITVAEKLTVGRRGRFYDSTGALRDMVPNHLFQVLSLVAMEPPSCFEANAVDRKSTRLNSS